MSHFLDDPLETEDIDALNDETFGDDFVEDWEEEEHEKLVIVERSSEFVDTGSIVQIADSKQNDGHPNRFEPYDYSAACGGSNTTGAKLSNNNNQLNDDLFPDCEDIITKSVLDVVSDEDEDFLVKTFSKNYDNDIQNGVFQNSKFDAKEKAKNIDLESLRPPSPSILPFDHTFMSSVWRPPSPPENNNNNQPSPTTTGNHHRYSPITAPVSTPKESPTKPSPPSTVLEEKVFNSNVPLCQIPVKFIKAEDLEADLTTEKNHPSSKTTSPNRQPNPMAFRNMPANMNMNMNNSPFFQNKQIPGNLMEFATMQFGNKKWNYPPSIPAPPVISPKQILQPPPGFARVPAVPNKMSTQPLNHPMFDPKSSPMQSMNQFQMFNNNSKTAYKSFMDKLPLLMMNSGMVTPPKNHSIMSTPITPNAQPIPFHPMQHFLDPMLQQQRITMNKIITPAQAQRSYHHLKNFVNKNQDKFAGFMTQKEKEWLLKIFRLQCKVNDPYVEDYYEVNYLLKKSSEKLVAKQLEMMNDGQHEAASKLNAETMLVLPQLAQVEEYKPKYIQFDNALGKIQVLNSKCPRKLVEFNIYEDGDADDDDGVSVRDGGCKLFANYKLDLHAQYLLKIERVYEHFLDIEDENKRLPILPDSVKQEHRNKRQELCKKLFHGLTTSTSASAKSNNKKDDNKESQFFVLINRTMPTLKKITTMVDPEILKIDKGLFLALRSLLQLDDQDHLIVLLASLLKSENFGRLQALEQKLKMNLGAAILKAISNIKTAKALIYIVSQMDDADIFTNVKYGSHLLISLFKQYEHSDDKLLYFYFWKLFVQTLIQKLPETGEPNRICTEHLVYLKQL